MRARFDDLRPGHRRSFEFTGLEDWRAAGSSEEVPSIVHEAERWAAAGAWVAVGLSYEAAAGLDPSLAVRDRAGPAPLAWYAAYSNIQHDPGWDKAGAFDSGPWSPAVNEANYVATLRRIRELIGEGSTYQVNYTIPFHSTVTGDPLGLYRGLLESQSGGYGAYFATDDWAVLSASPELFLRWEPNGRILSRPMKGTRRRGGTAAEDRRLHDELQASDKDRAENVMIVDLIRNDLGQVCEFGSVHVDRLFEVEKYDTVWQLTSQVSGFVRDDVRLLGVLTALFPCGSVTGAPKVRTMEIIRELESAPRGIYCGALGYLSPDPAEPRAQFNVAIRTVELDRRSGSARYGSGGGITWDSRPTREWNEVTTKTAVLEAGPGPLTLIETMRWEPASGVVRRHRHLDRMAASARHFDVPLDLARLEQLLDSIDSPVPLRVRATVSRSGHHAVDVEPGPPVGRPVKIALDTEQVSSTNVFLYHKTNRRGVYEAAARRHPKAEDVILVNEHGHVTESTRANVAARFGERWLTPPVADGLLAGTLRDELVQSGELAEQSIPASDIRSADDLELISSLRGRRPAILLPGAGMRPV